MKNTKNVKDSLKFILSNAKNLTTVIKKAETGKEKMGKFAVVKQYMAINVETQEIDLLYQP